MTRKFMIRHVGIVGSRQRQDRESVRKLVNSLPTDIVVVSGRAPGPDLWAEQAANARGLQTLIFPPDFAGAITGGQRTRRYHRRNQMIIDTVDELFAFVSLERTGGTEDTIRRAQRKGISVHIM
jgi:predicted Rossmann fold nucleotide-binding protein DprA/Smf involved in DNA uptake